MFKKTNLKTVMNYTLKSRIIVLFLIAIAISIILFFALRSQSYTGSTRYYYGEVIAKATTSKSFVVRVSPESGYDVEFLVISSDTMMYDTVGNEIHYWDIKIGDSVEIQRHITSDSSIEDIFYMTPTAVIKK